MRVLHEGMGDKYMPCPLLVQYVAAGWFGKKQGSHHLDQSVHNMLLSSHCWHVPQRLTCSTCMQVKVSTVTVSEKH